ncbi:class I SAM-dependent DNA methyltransferase [Nocardia sp. NPDC058499]|uniref:class I SAM-dependent DNA methyltransferase n=1 Tax=Nocardia sp. NPDC058499 TaxID=3346530 RepID=UPI003651F89B
MRYATSGDPHPESPIDAEPGRSRIGDGSGTKREVANDVLYRQMLSGQRCWAVDSFGHRLLLPTGRWLGGQASTPADRFADEKLLEGCTAPTLDLGCGPGRLTAALAARGVPALGVDISAPAVEMTIRRGGTALRSDVFAPLPGRAWGRVLLADGNIGIGGEPVRILRRARELLAPGGIVIAELDSPQTEIRTECLRWESDLIASEWYLWARVGWNMAAEIAAAAGLRLIESTVVSGRFIVSMCNA